MSRDTPSRCAGRLKQGIAEWNAWLGANPRICPDLFGANLSGADLSEADLSLADLSRADLSEAYLSGARLRGAFLRGANLSDAKMEDAILSLADLSLADLSRADLSRADLRGTDLRRAALDHAYLRGAILNAADARGAKLYNANLNAVDLEGTNLTGTELGETIFADVDLTGVIGLETCEHLGPSVIDHLTLEKSKSKPLPLAFLRGVGLPDNLIDYLPSIFNQAIQHYSCFISYSSKDDEFAHRIHADLQNKGVRCWFAPHDLPIGNKILDAIDAAIRLREKVVLILSEHSIKSDWVEDEVSAGFEEERKRGQIVLFPVRLDEAVMNTNEAWAAKLRARNIGDFRKWKDHDVYKQSLARVLRDLAKPQVL
jgi:TIR domain/Pentapeptide repeats (8 copies)